MRNGAPASASSFPRVSSASFGRTAAISASSRPPTSAYVFTLADGEQLFIGAVSDKRFDTLCRVLDAQDLASDPALSTNAKRVAVRPELLRRLGEILQYHGIGEFSPRLEAAGIPYAPIVRPEQLVDDPHLKTSGGLVPMATDDGGTTDVVLLPLLMGGRRPVSAGRWPPSANTPKKCFRGWAPAGNRDHPASIRRDAFPSTFIAASWRSFCQ
jgi:crotonobetainyl-CoA:carnitine CoA-transferase CaiB-like acyl-CoA transferase